MSVSQLQQLEKFWESEIHKGNELFKSAAFTEAYKHYMEAMIVSELLLEETATGSKNFLRVPGMYFTACINLANTYWGMQDLNNAADYFLYCTYKLKQLSVESDIDPVLQKAASLYWLKAMQQYAAFSEKTGQPMPSDLDEEDTYQQLQKLKDLFAIGKENMN